MNYGNGRGNIFKDTPGTTNILIITTLVFFGIRAFDGNGTFSLLDKIALHPISDPQFNVSQVVTYFFAHVGTMNLLFTLLTMFFFGLSLERMLGTKKYLALYLGSGVGTGMAMVLLNLAGFGNFDYFFGSYGALAGLFVAVAFLMPDSSMILFPIPFPIKAKYSVPIIFAIALVMDFIFFKGISIFTLSKIVGAVVGFCLIYYWKKKAK